MVWVPLESSRLQTALVSTCTHLVDHVAVGEEVGSESVTGIHGFVDRVLVAEDHGGLVEEDDAHAARAHGIDAVVAKHVGLGLVLGEVGHDVAGVELALGDADDAGSLAALGSRKAAKARTSAS